MARNPWDTAEEGGGRSVSIRTNGWLGLFTNYPETNRLMKVSRLHS
jgi:hypothetical protein